MTGLDRRLFAALLGFALGALWRSREAEAELDACEDGWFLSTQKAADLDPRWLEDDDDS